MANLVVKVFDPQDHALNAPITFAIICPSEHMLDPKLDGELLKGPGCEACGAVCL